MAVSFMSLQFVPVLFTIGSFHCSICNSLLILIEPVLLPFAVVAKMVHVIMSLFIVTVA
jgi:hypothetical protein